VGRKCDRWFAQVETGVLRAVDSARCDRRALLSSVSALADAAARAAVASGGEMGCVAQGFMIAAMLASGSGWIRFRR